MSRLHAVLTDAGTAELDCPACGGRVVVRVDPALLRHSTPIRARARCRCGWAHAVYLERRASARREVDLEGELLAGGERVPVRVENLSRNGVRFVPVGDVRLAVGDRVVVAFALNPGRAQRFERRTAIRWIEGGAAGGEFVDERGRPEYDRAYDLALALHDGT